MKSVPGLSTLFCEGPAGGYFGSVPAQSVPGRLHALLRGIAGMASIQMMSVVVFKENFTVFME